ncbi:hypothetical protein ASG56_05640 [Rhodococcus sp. Leaf7]|nr:hypothetical protein ASG56_05640 [Rhodococcus sp. Leaf7]KQU42556.1 hypothetical protein ASG64_05640 [Rhodococcus sp. Leaf247]
MQLPSDASSGGERHAVRRIDQKRFVTGLEWRGFRSVGAGQGKVPRGADRRYELPLRPGRRVEQPQTVGFAHCGDSDAGRSESAL